MYQLKYFNIMKKTILLIIAILFCVVSYAQVTGFMKVPNDSTAFGVGLSDKYYVLRSDSNIWYRLDTITASAKTIKTAKKTKIDYNTMWHKIGNYVYPYKITDSIAIGKTTATAKLDVLGSSLFNGNFNIGGKYKFTNSNFYNIKLWDSGAFNTVKVDGGYLSNGLFRQSNTGLITAGSMFFNDTISPSDSGVFTKAFLDKDEVNWSIRDFRNPTAKIFYSLDINTCCGLDYQSWDNNGDSIRHSFSIAGTTGGNNGGVYFDAPFYDITITSPRSSKIFISDTGFYYGFRKGLLCSADSGLKHFKLHAPLFVDTARVNVLITDSVISLKKSRFITSGDSILIDSSFTASGSISVDSLGMVLGRAFIDISHNPTVDTCLVDSTFAIKGNIRIAKTVANKVNIYNWTKYVWIKNLTVGTIRITYEFLKPE